MTITRLHRAVLLMTMMAAASVYLWVFWSEEGKLFSISEIASLATMLIGIACCAYSMRYGLKRVLTIALIVLGAFVIVKFGLLTLEGSHTVASALMALGFGGVSVLFGLAIWLGYEYNVVRVRMCMLILAIGCLAMTIIDARVYMDFDKWWLEDHLYIVLCLLASSFIFVTMDPSMELPTMTTGAWDNIVSMTRRMISTDDAYMLTSDAEALRKHIESAVGEPLEILVRSNDFLSFNLVVTNKGVGDHLAEVRDLEKIFMPTLLTMRFNQAVFADDHVSFFGDNGKAMKILVFDQVKENMNQPMIFGRELNIIKKN